MITTSVSREFNAPDLDAHCSWPSKFHPPSGGLATHRGAPLARRAGDEAAAAARAATYLDAAGRLARAYDPTRRRSPAYLRCARCPVELVGAISHRPPIGYDWSLADLEKHSLLRVDKGRHPA